MDRFDLRILEQLVDSGRATQGELGDSVGLSGNAAGRRQRQLEESGVIAGYRAVPDMKRLGFAATVVVLIQLDRQSSETLAAFEAAIGDCPSVTACHLLSGGEDYLVTLMARGLDDFERIHRTELSQLPGVTRMQSLFSLREIISRPVPPALFLEEGKMHRSRPGSR